MDKEKLVRNIIWCVSIAFTIVFVLCGIYFLVEATESAWFLAPVLLCALCGGVTAGVAFYLSED